MKVNDNFFRAKSDKGFNDFLLFDRLEKIEGGNVVRKKYIRICIFGKKPYSNEYETFYVENDVEISYDDHTGIQFSRNEHLKVCFHIMLYPSTLHLLTFLKAIKKNSELSFKICLSEIKTDEFNPLLKASLFGIIDNKYYLLETYTGKSDIYSPVI